MCFLEELLGRASLTLWLRRLFFRGLPLARGLLRIRRRATSLSGRRRCLSRDDDGLHGGDGAGGLDGFCLL